MLAGPDATLATMRRAVGYSIAALAAAAEVDPELSAEAAKVLLAEKTKLAPLAKQLADAEHAMDEYDLGDGIAYQARVVLGDAVLDRGVRTANATTKLQLAGKPGLGAEHAFGARVSDLTRTKISIEPSKVLLAVDRLADLPDFDAKKTIAKDLKSRAGAQQGYLDDREKGDGRRNKLASNAIKLVADAADALASCKGALDEQFPRQRDYVLSFFLDLGSKRAARSTGGGTGPAPTTPDPATPHA